MLSRHFLRAKVLQSVYASEFGIGKDVITAEKNFKHIIERMNDLGILQVSTLLHLREVAEMVLEEGRKKYMPTEEEKNPSMRLVNNEFLRRLADNFELRREMENRNVNWAMEEDVFRKAFTNFRKTDDYKEYIANDPAIVGKRDKKQLWDEDKDLAIKLFKYLMNDEGVTIAFIERSLMWEDDFYQIAQYIFMYLKTLERDKMDEAMRWSLVFDKRNKKESDDYDFARGLLLNTLRNREACDDLIKKHLKGWEFDRVALMDILMLNMAINELTECPSIPEKVTVDEYIELSKEYSSDKSKLFINGILDKLIIELRVAGKIKKTGRGLLTNE